MPPESSTTDVNEVFGDFDGGVFMEKIGRALSDVAMGCVGHGKKGKVPLSFDVSRIGDSQQVKIDHGISFKVPTKTGSKSEDTTTSTPMYVNKGGKLSLFPEHQGQMFDKKGDVKSPS